MASSSSFFSFLQPFEHTFSWTNIWAFRYHVIGFLSTETENDSSICCKIDCTTLWRCTHFPLLLIYFIICHLFNLQIDTRVSSPPPFLMENIQRTNRNIHLFISAMLLCYYVSFLSTIFSLSRSNPIVCSLLHIIISETRPLCVRSGENALLKEERKNPDGVASTETEINSKAVATAVASTVVKQEWCFIWVESSATPIHVNAKKRWQKCI